MTKAAVHILLVSDQAAPSLLPALDPALKPAEAVLMVSGKMQARAEALDTVLHEAGVKTTRVALEDEHDFGKLENALLEVAGTREGQSIALNVTGGTKLMALAAQSVALAAGWAVFYVDADTDEVIWLGKEARRQPLTQQLRLRHYLRGYGFTLEEGIARPQPSQRHNDLLRTLVTQVGSLEKPIGQLNWLGQEAEEKKRNWEQKIASVQASEEEKLRKSQVGRITGKFRSVTAEMAPKKPAPVAVSPAPATSTGFLGKLSGLFGKKN